MCPKVVLELQNHISTIFKNRYFGGVILDTKFLTHYMQWMDNQILAYQYADIQKPYGRSR